MDRRTKSVGKIIFDRRTALSLTQKDVAKRWNVSQMYISRLERKTLEKLKNMYLK